MSKLKIKDTNRSKYAARLAHLEGKKSQARISDIQELMKIMVNDDAKLTKHGYRSPLQMMKNEANKIRKKARK